MKFLILNGPNLNIMRWSEPGVPGELDYNAIMDYVQAGCEQLGIETDCCQTNHEGDLVDAIQQANHKFDFIIFNAAAFTHYSIAIRDAIAAIDVPVIEVHLSNIHQREEFRHTSVLAPVAMGQICGLGVESYLAALEAIIYKLNRAE